MSLAQITGLPILPCSYRVNWKIRFKTWDRFLIPLPFAQCEVAVGEPVRIPRDATDEERERLRKGLEQTLRSLGGD